MIRWRKTERKFHMECMHMELMAMLSIFSGSVCRICVYCKRQAIMNRMLKPM